MGKMKGAIEIDVERCKGCALCVAACPLDVISMAKMVNRNGYRYVEVTHQDNCIGCASCGMVCPDACITVYRAKIDE